MNEPSHLTIEYFFDDIRKAKEEHAIRKSRFVGLLGELNAAIRMISTIPDTKGRIVSSQVITRDDFERSYIEVVYTKGLFPRYSHISMQLDDQSNPSWRFESSIFKPRMLYDLDTRDKRTMQDVIRAIARIIARIEIGQA